MRLSILICLVLFNAGRQEVDSSYLLGRFDPSTDSRFVKLRPEHTAGAAINGYLRKETYDAFTAMFDAARKDGVKLVIISATRNFNIQKQIWESKWNGKVKVEGKDLSKEHDAEVRARTILRYSSMPGSSRHHWGTDMDLNALENSYFESGEGRVGYQWLRQHAAEFGFCQPYTSKALGRTGYEEEKWHWSYLPLSGPFLKEYISRIKSEDIQGFSGSQTAPVVRIIDDYVNGVSCK